LKINSGKKMNIKDLVLKTGVVTACGLLSLQVNAAVVTMNYDISYGAVPAVGPTPWMTATFDDGGTTGSVTLSMTLAGTVGSAAVDQVYFNLDDSTGFNVTNLSFLYDMASTGPALKGKVKTKSNKIKAGGGDLYDIQMIFPNKNNAKKNEKRWEVNQTVIYNITSTDLITADSFNVVAALKNGGPGTYYSAAHVLSTGPLGNDSDWIAAGVGTVGAVPNAVPNAVPVPAAVWLFGSGLLGLVGVARRKRA
jgi:hypothetical protein